MKMQIHSEKMSDMIAKKDGSGTETHAFYGHICEATCSMEVYEHRKDNGELMTYVNNQTTEWSVKIMMTMLKLCNTPFFGKVWTVFQSKSSETRTTSRLTSRDGGIRNLIF
jgi:hypothetical protein